MQSEEATPQTLNGAPTHHTWSVKVLLCSMPCSSTMLLL